MASLCVSAPCNVASSASSLSGLSFSSSPRPSSFRVRVSSASPARALAVSTKHDVAPVSAPPAAEDRDMRRRAVVFAAFVSALSVASAAGGAFAAESPAVRKKEKCQTICVQNRTASCCYGH